MKRDRPARAARPGLLREREPGDRGHRRRRRGRAARHAGEPRARRCRAACSSARSPGPKNSLGLAKFIFPNAENVYMHGTPAQSLFSRARRDFSHGCIRLEDPARLAEWVLRDQPEWTRAAHRRGHAGRAADAREPEGAADGHPLLRHGPRELARACCSSSRTSTATTARSTRRSTAAIRIRRARRRPPPAARRSTPHARATGGPARGLVLHDRRGLVRRLRDQGRRRRRPEGPSNRLGPGRGARRVRAGRAGAHRSRASIAAGGPSIRLRSGTSSPRGRHRAHICPSP